MADEILGRLEAAKTLCESIAVMRQSCVSLLNRQLAHRFPDGRPAEMVLANAAPEVANALEREFDLKPPGELDGLFARFSPS